MKTFETGVFILSVYMAGNAILGLLFMVACGAGKTSDGELGLFKAIGLFLLFSFIAFAIYR